MQNTQHVKGSTKSIFIPLCLHQKVNWHSLISNTHKENNDTSHISKVTKQINGRFQTQGHVFRPNCKTLPWQCSHPGIFAVPLVDRFVSQYIDFHRINYISDGMNILIALCTLRKYQTQIFIFKYILNTVCF